MEIYEIRKLRLRELIGPKRGAATRFADENGQDASFLSQILNGHRKMGEKAARRLEAECDLPEGYFDKPIGSDSGDQMDKIRNAITGADWMDPKSKAYFIGLIENMRGNSE